MRSRTEEGSAHVPASWASPHGRSGGAAAGSGAAQCDSPISRWRKAQAADAAQALPPKRSDGSENGAVQSGSAISRWRQARGMDTPERPQSLESSARGGTPAASRNVELRGVGKERGGAATDYRGATSSASLARAPATNSSQERRVPFSNTQSTGNQNSAGGNEEKFLLSKTSTQVSPREEFTRPRPSAMERKNLTGVPQRSYTRDMERQANNSPYRGRTFSSGGTSENIHGDDIDMYSPGAEPFMERQALPQVFNDDEAESRNEIINGSRRGRFGHRQSFFGNSNTASRLNMLRARSQPVSAARSQPLENEDLVRFLGAYGTPSRRHTSVVPVRRVDRQTRVPNDPPLSPSCLPPKVSHRTPRPARTPSTKYRLIEGTDDDTGESAKLLEHEVSDLLSGLEAYQKRLERAALVIGLERQRRKRY